MTSFLIGAATAAHQVEGNNVFSDAWAVETMPNTTNKEPSLDAVDHYHKYAEDISYLAKAGCNAYRFSIEWARIEPEEGIFDAKEIAHYRDVLTCCHTFHITPIVTLHHFTSPKWLISKGGWESDDTIQFFARYCAYVVKELGELMPYICTINEANMGKQIAKLMVSMQSHRNHKEGDIQVGLNLEDLKNTMGAYYASLGQVFQIDPNRVHMFLSARSTHGEEIILLAHQEARKRIKQLYPLIQVGLTLSIYDHQAIDEGGQVFAKQGQMEDFLSYLPYLQEDDFIGVQNYTRKVYDKNGEVPLPESAPKTDMGYEFYPESIGNVVAFVAQHWDKSILITENGIASKQDDERVAFIERAVNSLTSSVTDHKQLIGYLYWSLLDNYEWQLGFEKTFGLIAVDRTTQTRYPKRSLTVLGQQKVC